LACRSEGPIIDRTVDNGVEVILNHVEPYRLPGQPVGIELEPEFSIDFGSDTIGDMGLANATEFEVDDEGRIYFLFTNKTGDLIFQFDPKGRFLHSFGSKGEGPGEIEYINHSGFDENGNLLLSDMGNRKVLIFDKIGALIDELRYPPGANLFIPLGSGNGFDLWQGLDETGVKRQRGFRILNPQNDEIAILDRQTPYDFNELGFRGIISNPLLQARFHQQSVYVANEERGYELLKFDLDGNLTQIIRKEYEPVSITPEEKKARAERFEQFGDKVWFPDEWLPFGDFMLDEHGYLFVRTFERDETTGEYLFDVFNADGVFIFRKSFNIYTSGDRRLCARFRNSRLYRFEEKPDSYRIFKCSRLVWRDEDRNRSAD